MKRFAALAALLCLTGAATARAEPADPQGLVGRWALVSVGGVPAPAEYGEWPDRPAHRYAGARVITFTADGVGGRNECNTYWGLYRASDGEIAFGDVGMTTVGCNGDPWDRVVMQATGARRYRFSANGELILSEPGGRDFVFRRCAADSDVNCEPAPP